LLAKILDLLTVCLAISSVFLLELNKFAVCLAVYSVFLLEVNKLEKPNVEIFENNPIPFEGGLAKFLNKLSALIYVYYFFSC